jgi:hypothetical protein
MFMMMAVTMGERAAVPTTAVVETIVKVYRMNRCE